MNEPSHTAFRVTTLLFALLLGFQSIWLFGAEIYRPGVYRLLTDTADAIEAQNGQGDAAFAAKIGAIRGVLWAESAYTYAYLLFNEKPEPGNKDSALSLTAAGFALGRAIEHGPQESGAWLLRAGLALRYPSLGFNAPEALKMSYYTGPSEEVLVSLRLRTAAQLDSFRDVEIAEFVTRDLRMLLARNQKSTIGDAYNAGSPSGKRFIYQAVSDIDPTSLDWLRAGAKK